MKKILIVGATSAIAEATARLWARDRNRLYLVGRDSERLQSMVADLKIRGADAAYAAQLDANDFSRHEAAIDQAIKTLDGIDVALIAYGTLGNQDACERDFGLTLKELNTNAISVISLLTHLANHFESQKHGTIAVISSVAGDRGRQSNYVYGAAKGALSIFMQGLRQRLYKSGVQVLTIKPGFVDTPMTKELKKGLLWVSPEKIALDIAGAIDKRKHVVYTPWFWRGIMLVIKLIPEKIFNRIKL